MTTSRTQPNALTVAIVVICGTTTLVAAQTGGVGPSVPGPSTPAGAAFWWLVGGSVAVPCIVAAINGILTLIARAKSMGGETTVNVRPDPHSDYRTRHDCIAIHEKDREWIRRVEDVSRREIKEATGELHTRVDTLHTSMNAQFRDLAGSMGRIEGRLGVDGD